MFLSVQMFSSVGKARGKAASGSVERWAAAGGQREDANDVCKAYEEDIIAVVFCSLSGIRPVICLSAAGEVELWGTTCATQSAWRSVIFLGEKMLGCLICRASTSGSRTLGLARLYSRGQAQAKGVSRWRGSKWVDVRTQPRFAFSTTALGV